MFGLIAKVVTRRGWIVLLGWVLLAAVLQKVAPPWSSVSRDDDVRFFPPEYASVIGAGILERGFPSDVTDSTVVLIGERGDSHLTRADLAYLDRVTKAVRKLGEAEPGLGIKKVFDRNEPLIGEQLRVAKPDAGEIVLAGVLLKSTMMSKQSRITVSRIVDVLDDYRTLAPRGLRLGITGSAAVGRDSNMAANDSIEATTIATILLVVAILLLVYRSPVLALIPLLSIALSVWVSLNIIALLANPPVNFQVINVTQVFVVVILYGAGTDYCLFLIARYREELARGRTRGDAIREAITQVGGALVASAGTVILGLGMLWFSTFAKVRYSGPAIALSLGVALAASLTLAPMMLSALRGAVFWPFRPPHHVHGHDPESESLRETPMFGFWARVADWIIKRPGTILGLSVLAMAPFAWFGLHTKANYDIMSDLERSAPSIAGAETFRQYYPEGELGPSKLMIEDSKLDFSTPEGRSAIGKLSQALAAVPHVTRVRSLSRPTGTPGVHADPEPNDGTPAAPAQEQSKGGFNLGQLANQARGVLGNAAEAVIRQKILEHYVSTAPSSPADRNHITRVEVVFDVNPFGEVAQETLQTVLATAESLAVPGGVLEGAKFGFGGTTVQITDLARVTTLDKQRMYVLVTLGVYVILVVLLRKPGICLYLILTVIFGYLASLGLTDIVFRALHHGPQPYAGLDWKVGFFLFVILVAVGEDYNIFLMSRVIEEEEKHGAIEGTRRAVAHTGGIISSCGVIMAGTFLAMLFGRLSTLRQLGFALGMGVLLDTFIVRPILVPAFVVLWHRILPKAKLAGTMVDAHHEQNGNGAVPVARPVRRQRLPLIVKSEQAQTAANH